jgi:UPF0271 protein
MKSVLDTSFFLSTIPAEGEVYTTPSVVEELRDLRSKSRLDVLCVGGLTVTLPSAQSRRTVKEAAERTGDAGVLSGTDCDILALAIDLGAALYTDDFAVQNVASELGIRTVPMQQKKARKFAWKFRCSGCGRFFDHDGECPVCGSGIKRKLK